jgi:transcription-repair coupling factor (superfamily II helicase)
MTSVDLRKVRETLESLKDFDIDEHFHTTPFDSATLLPRYEQVRDEYLKRRILHAFIAEVEKDTPNIEAPTEEEQAALEMRQREVFSNLVAQIHNFQTAKADLQSKYAQFTTKRDNLNQLMKEMENMNTTMEDDSMEDDTDVDEEELANQEEQLLLLQQQAASLKAEITKVQNESKELEIGIENLGVANENLNPNHLEQLRLENEKLESEVQRLDEVQEFYEKLVAVMEELSGIRVIGVEPVNGPGSQEELVFTIEVLGSHRIQIGLKPNEKSSEYLRVVYVKLLSSSLIQSHEYVGEEPVRLTIPEFSDLVDMSESCPPGDNLRFVVRESVARIQILEARLSALVDLKTESGVVVKIGKLQRTNGISAALIENKSLPF